MRTRFALLLLLRQVEADLAVKAVLQAFQMSLSCCMERSHLPMMRHQLVLRLMAAARAAGARANSADADAPLAAAAGWAALQRNTSLGSRAGNSSDSVAGVVQQHKLYQQEMRVWFAQQYTKCRAGASLLSPVQVAMQIEQQQQQLPPHLLGYTPSLVQAGGMHRMALRGHLGPIRKVVIAPDGKDVLTASDDGTVQVGAVGDLTSVGAVGALGLVSVSEFELICQPPYVRACCSTNTRAASVQCALPAIVSQQAFSTRSPFVHV
jgi:hypothetical protein